MLFHAAGWGAARRVGTRHVAGEARPAVVRDLGLSPWTTRSVWRRSRDRGEAGLPPGYAACGRLGPRFPAEVHAAGVGRAHAGETVTIRLAVLAEEPVWHIHDERGTLLRTHGAPELRRERILALAVSHRPHPVKSPAHQEGQPYTR